ncbi:MAG: hydrogenase maturation nickel metallochaperone HypA [Myxococcota bacterium]
MHELGITRNIVAICADNAQGRRVKQVTLEIGLLSDVMADAIEFCFDVCAQGTVVEGAKLEIVRPAGRGRCKDCNNEMALDAPYGTCDVCGSHALSIIAGKELSVKSMEVEQCA